MSVVDDGLVSVPAQVEFSLLSHSGRVRPLNEDAIGADPALGLFILADGLGGYNAGEIASTMAVSSLLAELGQAYEQARAGGELFDPARVLRDTLVLMNASIFRAALNSTAFEGMATTVVVAWLLGDTLWVGHTGDSRLYRYRRGTLEQLTRDHSFSQELLDAGMVSEEEARMLPAKNLVTRALGASPDIEPEVNPYDAMRGDLLLLCSDGLTEMITHHEIGGLLATHEDGLDEVARRLVDMANEAGGRDNVSVVLVRVGNVEAEVAGKGSAKRDEDEQSVAQSAESSASPAASVAGGPAGGIVLSPTGGGAPSDGQPTGSLATPGAAGRID